MTDGCHQWFLDQICAIVCSDKQPFNVSLSRARLQQLKHELEEYNDIPFEHGATIRVEVEQTKAAKPKFSLVAFGPIVDMTEDEIHELAAVFELFVPERWHPELNTIKSCQLDNIGVGDIDE